MLLFLIIFFLEDFEVSRMNISFFFKQFLYHTIVDEPSSAVPSWKTKNKRTLTQQARNKGQNYVSKSGKLIAPREFKRLHHCRKECSQKISFENQKIIFDSYWQQGSYEKRTEYVKSLMRLKPVQRARRRKDSDISQQNLNRKFSAEYHSIVDGHEVIVCKQCFLMTLGETHSFLHNISNKTWMSQTKGPIETQKGKHTPKNKTQPDKRLEVTEHISKFPAYESHYSRSHTCKKYLPVGSNATKMCKLYKDETSDPVSLKIYREVF